MKRLALVAVFLLGAASSATAIECQSKAGKGGHWSWRLIDRNKCWYRGQRSYPRALLHWPNSTEPKKIREPAYRANSQPQTSPDERTAAMAGIWECCGLPPAPLLMPPLAPFADRWNENEYRLLMWNGGQR